MESSSSSSSSTSSSSSLSSSSLSSTSRTQQQQQQQQSKSITTDSIATNSADTDVFYYEKDLKVDKKILSIMNQGGNEYHPSLNQFLSHISNETNCYVDISNSLKDRQGNEIPVLKVKANNQKNLEIASALIMERLDPHRDKMTFNIDVPYNDHSYIIGKDGTRIKQLSRMTGCHIHLPDCNKTSNKKSNKLSIAGTDFTAIDRARDQIRKSLPLNIGFKAQIKSGKFVIIDTASAEVQAVKRKYRVDVTFTNVIANTRYPEVTINVKGGRSQLEEIELATRELYHFVTEEKLTSNSHVMFTITIDVSHSHHQYVKGKNNCNLKVINQRSGAMILFPSNIDSNSNQVIIQSRNLLSTVMGWQELMGYLPLLLSFDVNFDVNCHQMRLQRLEKEFGVGIRTREKLSGHVYTVLIKTQERHSTYLQEIRQRIINLKYINDNNNNNLIIDNKSLVPLAAINNHQNNNNNQNVHNNSEQSQQQQQQQQQNQQQREFAANMVNQLINCGLMNFADAYRHTFTHSMIDNRKNSLKSSIKPGHVNNNTNQTNDQNESDNKTNNDSNNTSHNDTNQSTNANSFNIRQHLNSGGGGGSSCCFHHSTNCTICQANNCLTGFFTNDVNNTIATLNESFCSPPTSSSSQIAATVPVTTFNPFNFRENFGLTSTIPTNNKSLNLVEKLNQFNLLPNDNCSHHSTMINGHNNNNNNNNQLPQPQHSFHNILSSTNNNNDVKSLWPPSLIFPSSSSVYNNGNLNHHQQQQPNIIDNNYQQIHQHNPSINDYFFNNQFQSNFFKGVGSQSLSTNTFDSSQESSATNVSQMKHSYSSVFKY